MDIRGMTMREYPASDLDHQNLQELPTLLEMEEPPARPVKAEMAVQTDTQQPRLPSALVSFQDDHEKLLDRGTLQIGDESSDDKYPEQRRILRQVLPGPYYPSYLRQGDKKSFEDYIDAVPSLEATIKSSLGATANASPVDGTSSDGCKSPHQDKDASSSPTFLTLSQKIYDAEMSRRDSINGRCTAVLSTAAIIGTLVVAAGQLGLTLRGGATNGWTWPVLAFFLISLVYIGYSITIALQVHGDIQGEVIDWTDLNASNPKNLLDAYNFNVGFALLTYAKLNWCLNNNFKHRLHSAGRALRDGVIAVIIAGALSPLALTPSTTNNTLPAPQPVSSHVATHKP
jgi:hypothetical protein